MRIDDKTQLSYLKEKRCCCKMTIIIEYAEDWNYIDEFIEELSLNYMEQFK